MAFAFNVRPDITWMKEYREQLEAEQVVENDKSTTKEEPAQHYDF